MSIPHARAGERGASILAGLVLMAMLGAAVVGIGSSNLSVQSQLAQSAAPTAAQIAAQKAAAEQKERQDKIDATCRKLTARTVDPGTPIQDGDGTTPLKKAEKTVEESACVSVFNDGTAEKPKNVCYGLKSRIVLSGTGGSIRSTPDKTAKKGECKKEGGFYDIDGKKLTTAQAREAIKGLTSDQQADILGGLKTGDIDKAQQSVLDQALTEQRESVSGELEKVADQQRSVSDKLLELTKSSCSYDECDTPEAEEEFAKLREREKELAKERAELTQQLDDLDKNKKSLADLAAQGDPNKTEGKDETPEQKVARERREAEQRSAAEAAQRTAAQQQQQTGFGQGDLSKILQGLMGGNQQKQQPAAGNQTPQAPGTCAAGQLICSGSTLYSRNNQCVDTVAQICQNGCSGNTCVQQGQNCPAAPVQPDPSGCQAGTWKPTYTGACVNGWQCTSGSGTGQLAAQISCQPQIADVGMSLAISYSCSSGTSVGEGFQTNGAQSGSATVTVANPPAGTNTATYGLKCANQGQTANAQCTVQVGRPFIVLVANPKAVASSTASQIGWVTSGMQSCVISSPDLPAFTAQNAGNTSVNGTATTPPLTSAARFRLHCDTVGGGTRDATTTVSIIGVPDVFTDPVGAGD